MLQTPNISSTTWRRTQKNSSISLETDTHLVQHSMCGLVMPYWIKRIWKLEQWKWKWIFCFIFFRFDLKNNPRLEFDQLQFIRVNFPRFTYSIAVKHRLYLAVRQILWIQSSFIKSPRPTARNCRIRNPSAFGGKNCWAFDTRFCELYTEFCSTRTRNWCTRYTNLPRTK